MATPAETTAMRRAIALAAEVLGSTNPNPAVGAVVLDASGAVIGEGATRPAGGAHAEVEALAAAGGRARDGVLVVTLEPCRHVGRTPACTDAIVAAGVSRVLYAVADPHDVASGGAETLVRAACGRGERRLAAVARRGAPSPSVRHMEVRRDARRPHGSRRWHQPMDHW
jgi:diaminohydroxyphosphoribosylaminopyrimidine deaminase/5-amino-6-(5-phosphoribosylamino)uracil reductase